MEREQVEKENVSSTKNHATLIDQVKMSKLLFVVDKCHSNTPQCEEQCNRSATNNLLLKPPSINGNPLVFTDSNLNNKQRACIFTSVQPGPASSSLKNERSRNFSANGKGFLSEDPMKLLLMAAESESQASHVNLDMNGFDWSKRVLPSIKVMENHPFFLLSRPLPLPRGLPNPLHFPSQFPVQINSNTASIGKNNPPSTIKADPLASSNSINRKEIAIYDVLFNSNSLKATPDNRNLSNGQEEKGYSHKKGASIKFECTHPGCTKFFPSRSRLRRHVLIHTGQKMFKCLFEECDRRFSRRDNMMQHARTHTPHGPPVNHASIKDENKINRSRQAKKAR